ncbi:MAG: hypothetical protein H0V01_02240 [Bacteroidetes bacterium]|nr:hypothetical protein [Bacteroidota bacterium]HET6243993.1 hypothetical protein [Bacteroidia bacterium]
MKIETKKASLNKSQNEIFEFLSDFRNFEKLMPKDKIEKWTATSETCSFNISGMADIGMKIEKTVPHSEINIISHGKNPFEFTLNVYIEPEGLDKSIAFFIFRGDINPFLKMMAEKPLTNFFNMLVAKMEEIYG